MGIISVIKHSEKAKAKAPKAFKNTCPVYLRYRIANRIKGADDIPAATKNICNANALFTGKSNNVKKLSGLGKVFLISW